MKSYITFIVVSCFFFFHTPDLFGEGSKQLRPDTTYNGSILITSIAWWPVCFATSDCDEDHQLFVRVASPSEKIYLGFGNTSLVFRIKKDGIVVFGPKVISLTAPGYIHYVSQAIAGPDVLNIHGYDAIEFAPGIPGDYCIEFQPQPEITKFDITVIDTSIVPLAAIDGRLWSKAWLIGCGTTAIPYNVFLGTMYVYSDDSVVTSINFNQMLPGNFQVTANSNGCFPPPVPFNLGRQSQPGRVLYPQYKVFLCNPDSNQFPTGTLGSIQNGITVTPQCDGSVTLTFTANKPGRVDIEIEVNPSPGHQPEDVSLIDSVTAGVNSIIWNGVNGLGVPVSSGTVVGIMISYVNGLTNVGLYAVLRNPNGIIVQLVRPSGAPLAMYWDDILLANHGGVTQLNGCYSSLPSNGCHSWDGDPTSGSLGAANTVNSWWYASSSSFDLGYHTVMRAPGPALNILGSLQPCSNSAASYTVQPDPLPGGDPGRYDWVLTDAGTGNILLNVTNMGTTIAIDFSNYPPGQKWLKVRGNSTACGSGPFGPAPNGILINSIQSTQVTNTVNTFHRCSGEQTDILLQASLPSSTFNYTATATSPLVTGYFPDNANPIQQTLYHAGNETDTVIYRVVPFATPCYGDTADFFVIVNPYLPAGISIAASANPVCAGTPVTYTANANNAGLNPVYQWIVNGTNAPNASNSVYTYVPENGDVVSCTLTSSQSCVTGNPAISDSITMSVNPVLPVSVSVDASANPVCSGTTVTYTATPVNGGATPAFQWIVNAGNATNATNATYTCTPVNGDVVQCVLISSNTVCTSHNPDTSNAINMVVSPLQPVSVSVSPSANPVCAGTPVTYTANTGNAGSAPVFQWVVNSVYATNATNASYAYNPMNGDVVTCEMTSSESCVTGNPALSNEIIMIVNTNLPAGVTITASANPFCPGSPVTFTASAVNGGVAPIYQWIINATNATNATNAVFIYNPVHGDSVSCVMTSSLSCVTGNPASSAKMMMSGTLAPIVTFTPCFDTVTTLNAKPIRLKGGLPLNGTYSGPGVAGAYLHPNVAGAGTHIITYSYTNAAQCSNQATVTIVTLHASPFTCGETLTDIRDNKSYPTVRIGLQCWMQTNLDFGSFIQSIHMQYDNCLNEKYCYDNQLANCSQYGGLYQWNEVMRYDETPGGQGLCPPGWHVPTESEWIALFNFYLGNGLAGKPLQDPTISGFKARSSGVFYLNSRWSYMDFATLLWSSTLSGSGRALAHGMNVYDFSVSLYPSSRANAFPVRCVSDPLP